MENETDEILLRVQLRDLLDESVTPEDLFVNGFGEREPDLIPWVDIKKSRRISQSIKGLYTLNT